jgi:hypothetical protein
MPNNLFKTQLDKRVPVKPEFSGPFHRWKVSIYTDREQGLEELFLVFSTGKRGAIHRYLWLKNLWEQLSKEEYLLFITMNETLRDEKMFSFLKASISYPKATLRDNLLKMESLLGLKLSSRSSFLGYRRMRLELHRSLRKLPKVPKFSGYIKSPSKGQRGSKKAQLLEPTSYLWVEFEKEFDWYSLLTVGEIPLFNEEVTLSLKIGSKKNRNDK